MNVTWLQDFLALAEVRHFTKAAARRSISQAAFSRRIKALENWLGTQLIERSGTGVGLTADGRIFEAEARQILKRILTSRESLSGARVGNWRSLTISMSHAVATKTFPGMWGQWSLKRSINAVTRIGNVNDAVADFLTGHSELLLCHRSKQVQVMLDMKNAHSCVVRNDRLVPVVKAGSDLSRLIERKQAWEGVPMVRYVPNRYFSNLVDSIIEQAPFQINGPHVVQTEMSDVVCTCVADGLGVGWLPESVVADRADVSIIAEPSLCMDLEIVAFIGKMEKNQAAHEIWEAICRTADGKRP